jgi:hypothetical protein
MGTTIGRCGAAAVRAFIAIIMLGLGGAAWAGPATHFSVTAPASTTAGSAFTVTVTALDAGNAVDTGYAGTVHFTSSDGLAILPADSPLTNGTGSFSVTLIAAGTHTVTATDTVDNTITGTSASITVNAAATTHFFVSAIAIATGNIPVSVTVEAMDAFGNITSGYAGTVHFTSSDPLATLPADSVLVGGLGLFNNPILRTGGSQTVTVTDTVDSSITGTSNVIAVTAATTTHFILSVPANPTAGVAFSFTVTAADSGNNPVLTYAGLVHFTSNDGAAVLPADSTLTNGSGTFSGTLKTVAGGGKTISATDTVTSATGFGGPITVSAAAATHFVVSAPASTTVGTFIGVTVTATDPFGNTDPGYARTIHFTSTDPSATLPADTSLFFMGVGSYAAKFATDGPQTITATDVLTPSITGTSNTIAIPFGPVTHFLVTAPATATAGSAFSVTVAAKDATNATVTTYAGTVHFTSSDGQAVLPADATLTNGAGTFSSTLKTAGTQSVSATDTVTSSITGTATLTVSAAAATHYIVSAPATATGNVAFSFTVTALDPFNNTATAYAGTAHFTSTDGAASLPANSTLTNGTGTFSATLRTGGAQTITATDTLSPGITGTSNTITVTPATATHFLVTAPATATAGSAFTLTVTAQDAGNSTVTTYSGIVHFTSSDGQAVLPANATLTNGVGTFSATLKTAGVQNVLATDTVTSSITGTATLTVSAAAATHYIVSAPATATGNVAFSFTVTALDPFNNTATAYAGTVHFTSSDGAASLPANSTLTNGTGTFSATLRTGGAQTITATDTVTGTITGTSNTITVSTGPATHFLVTAPATATAGSAFTLTVAAKDASNNTVTSYAGTVHFTSSDGQAVLPADATLTNGVGTFSSTLKTAGTQSISATDTVTSSITGTATLAVSAAAATHFVVSAPATATGNVAFSFTVTALDQFNNTATGYGGTAHFTSTDGTATLPANSTLTSGTGTFSATLRTAGTRAITATDTVSASITGTSGSITVTAAAATHFSVTAPATAVPGVAFSFTVSALDASNNVVTSYAGTVHFTSSDGGAILPANATLASGTGTFSATLGAAGSQTLTATDTVTVSITGTSGAIAVGTVLTTFSGPSATGTGTVTASFTGGGAACTYVTPQLIPLTGGAASPPAGSAPAGILFPHGLFDFRTSGCTPGSALAFTIVYPQALPAGTQYYKYGPTAANTTPHWYVLPATITGNTVTFSITDGGLGDDDLAANGGIVDQGGPGTPGGGGGAFTQVPTLSEWALALLALAVAGLAMRRMRRVRA